MVKSFISSFVTNSGRHTPRSFGMDMNLDNMAKQCKKSIPAVDKFSTVGDTFVSLERAFRMVSFLKQCHAGLTENGPNSVTNSDDTTVPYFCEGTKESLGRNEALYFKTNMHIGKRYGSKIAGIMKSAYVEKLTKRTACSQEDYLDHKNRERLKFNSGFNEKGFSFLTEDTYFSVNDYYELLQIDEKYKDKFQSADGSKDIYGCILKTKNNFKIKNHLDYYSLHIKIHLIKIIDLETDVRSLIQEMTHHPYQSSIVDADSGRLPKDFQYTEAEFKDTDNNFSVNFLTNLNCNLKQSSKFRERARIVKSWSKTLPAGSIWDFNLTCHTGNGIYLNRLYDIQNNLMENLKSQEKGSRLKTIESSLNLMANQTTAKTIKESLEKLKTKSDQQLTPKSEHPSGYIYCLEYVGDRRASVVNKKGDIFSGYSPCDFRIEFYTEVSFLANAEDEDEIITWRKSNQEKNFGEDSIFNDIFYPNRKNQFHIPIDKINTLGSKGKKEYNLLYDQSIKSSSDFSDIFSTLANSLEEYGIDINKLSEEELDLKENFKKFPKIDEDDTMTPSPAEER